MTVVRLRDGTLLLHSPVPLNDDLARELKALGRVAYIVCPNRFHHVHAAPMIAAFPDAKVYAPAGLRNKRRDLRIDADLESVTEREWGGELIPVHIDGCMLDETVFVHPASRTVISADLTENFATSDHLYTRTYLKLAGLHGRVGWSRFFRPLYRDRRAALRSVDRLLEHDFDRLIIAHGSPLGRDAKAGIRQTFAWM